MLDMSALLPYTTKKNLTEKYVWPTTNKRKTVQISRVNFDGEKVYN